MIRHRIPLERSRKPIPRKRTKPRRGPLRDPGYLAFLRERCPCIVALGFTSRYSLGKCDAAHGPVNGRGSKGPDNEALPLCREHHREQHSIGFRAFQEKHGFEWLREAAAHYTAYQISREAYQVSARDKLQKGV